MVKPEYPDSVYNDIVINILRKWHWQYIYDSNH
jgi:hypothetical protein